MVESGKCLRMDTIPNDSASPKDVTHPAGYESDARWLF